MADILGNVIRSEIKQLEAGVYIAKDGGNRKREVLIDHFFLVHLIGEAPFLRLGEMVSLPTLCAVGTFYPRKRIDPRDLVIILKFCEITGDLSS